VNSRVGSPDPNFRRCTIDIQAQKIPTINTEPPPLFQFCTSERIIFYPKTALERSGKVDFTLKTMGAISVYLMRAKEERMSFLRVFVAGIVPQNKK
jgi:hypothetical protein